MDWYIALPENEKSTGLILYLFIILMVELKRTIQNQAGS